MFSRRKLFDVHLPLTRYVKSISKGVDCSAFKNILAKFRFKQRYSISVLQSVVVKIHENVFLFFFSPLYGINDILLYKRWNRLSASTFGLDNFSSCSSFFWIMPSKLANLEKIFFKYGNINLGMLIENYCRQRTGSSWWAP